MKRLLSALLVVCLIVSSGFCVLAHAEEIPPDAPDQDQEQPQEGIPVEVSTLEELQEALVTVEDGDTIAISSEILLDGIAIETEKEIAITRSDSYLSGALFRMRNGAKISGISFIENAGSTIICDSSANIATEITDCQFSEDSSTENPFISLFLNADVVIDSCTFEGANNTALAIKQNTTLSISNSTFTDNCSKTQGGAIYNSGTLMLNGCILTNNHAVSGGGIFNQGNLSLVDCKVYDNTVESKKFGTDILSFGTLSITDMLERDAEYYEESTGARIDLPLVDCSNTAKLVYLTEQQAEEYFAPAPAPEPTDPPQSGDNGEGDAMPPADDPASPEQPETPSDPKEPDNGESGEDTPDDGQEPSEPPSEPQEPGNGDDSEDEPSSGQEPTEQPETPPEDEPDEEDTYIPPVEERPTYRPPVIIQRPQEPTEMPAPALTCGDAVIDASRSVVLQGYGDGSLHEDDPLTRAQLATIIFRLLTDETIEKYGDGAPAFEDVPDNDWHYQYVSTIAKAGIVVGTGDGHYNPNGLVTWAQAITVLSRFVEPHEYVLAHIQYSGWALQAIQTAASLGWIEDAATFDPDSVISRGELVSLVNGVLENYR